MGAEGAGEFGEDGLVVGRHDDDFTICLLVEYFFAGAEDEGEEQDEKDGDDDAGGAEKFGVLELRADEWDGVREAGAGVSGGSLDFLRWGELGVRHLDVSLDGGGGGREGVEDEDVVGFCGGEDGLVAGAERSGGIHLGDIYFFTAIGLENILGGVAEVDDVGDAAVEGISRLPVGSELDAFWTDRESDAGVALGWVGSFWEACPKTPMGGGDAVEVLAGGVAFEGTFDEIRVADEVGDETGAGVAVDVGGGADLDDFALVEDGEAVC